MTKLTLAAAAALVIALPLGSALAQDNGGMNRNNAGANPGARQDAVEGRGNQPAAAREKPNFGHVISALNNAKSMTTELGSLTTLGTVSVVRISTLEGSNQAALDNAMTKNQADITALQTSISSNASLKQKLDAEGVTIADIVAIDVGAGGNVTIYTKG